METKAGAFVMWAFSFSMAAPASMVYLKSESLRRRLNSGAACLAKFMI
jgi:hypothetical protein